MRAAFVRHPYIRFKIGEIDQAWLGHWCRSFTRAYRLPFLFQAIALTYLCMPARTLTKCSQDTAHRDIMNLVEMGVLIRNPEGGRSTSYTLANRT